MSLISNDKLVMLSSFRAFADKCKKIFRPTYKKVTANPYICIVTSQNWSSDFDCLFTINGISSQDTAAICSILAGLSAGVTAYGAAYNLTSLGIESGKITAINNKVALIVSIPDLKSVNVDSSIFLNDKWYNTTDSITFLDTCDYDSYPDGIDLYTEASLEANAILIRNIGESASTDTEFSITNASGTKVDYYKGAEFTSILSSGKLAEAKSFALTGAVIGTATSDLASGVTVATTIDTSNAVLNNLIDLKVALVSVGHATDLVFGTIKLGSNPNKSALNLKCDSEYGAYVEYAGTDLLPYIAQIEKLPTAATDFSEGDIVQYVGQSTETLTNGFIYQASELTGTKVNHDYIFKFNNGTYQLDDHDYDSDNNPYDRFNAILVDGRVTFKLIKHVDETTQEITWTSDDTTITEVFTNEDFITLVGDIQVNRELIEAAQSVVITLVDSETVEEKKLTWAQKPILPDNVGPTYGAGTNISITDQNINAIGYSYDTTKHAMALGNLSYAGGNFCAAEGKGTVDTNGHYAHAEGFNTYADAVAAHAEGKLSQANGEGSHAGGVGTIASSYALTAIGTYNVEDADPLFIIGNGNDALRSTAYTLDTNGNEFVSGNTGHAVTSDDSSLGTVNISYNSKKYNFYNPTLFSAGGVTINVNTAVVGSFKGAREVILHIYNRSTSAMSFTISAATGVCKAMGDLTQDIPAGKCMEIVFTYWANEYVTYNGGYLV